MTTAYDVRQFVNCVGIQNKHNYSAARVEPSVLLIHNSSHYYYSPFSTPVTTDPDPSHPPLSNDKWEKRKEKKVEESLCSVGILKSQLFVQCHVISTKFGRGMAPYTPRSVSQLVAGRQRHITEQKDVPVRLAVPANRASRTLHHTLDNVHCQLFAESVGTNKKQAEVLSVEEEGQLWSTEAVGTDSPSFLLVLFFFYNGLSFQTDVEVLVHTIHGMNN